MLNRFCPLRKPTPSPSPIPLFLTDNIKMDRIPTKMKLKIHAPFIILFLFQVLNIHLIKVCKKEPPDLLFLAVFLLLHHQIYHFSQIFSTSFNIICEKDFVTNFLFLMDSLKSSPPLPSPPLPTHLTAKICCAKRDEFFLLMILRYFCIRHQYSKKSSSTWRKNILGT